MFCPERRGMGHGVNGAFTRFVVVRPDQLFRLPDDVPLEEGAVCEPFAAAVHAVCERTPLRLGDVALISGPGPIGLLCLKLFAAQGVKTLVAGTEADLARLGVAWKRLGQAHRAQACWREAATGLRVPTPAVFYSDHKSETIFFIKGWPCKSWGGPPPPRRVSKRW